MIIMIFTGWCNNHLEKYEFVNGKDDIPYMKWKKHVWNHQPVYNHQCWGKASQAVGLELEELNKKTAQNTN